MVNGGSAPRTQIYADEKHMFLIFEYIILWKSRKKKKVRAMNKTCN